MSIDYETAYMLRRYAEERYQQAKSGYRWAVKRAMEHFVHCLERGLNIPDESPVHLRLDDEELQVGFVVARHLWQKWMEADHET